MNVKVSELKKLYKNRKNDTEILRLRGLEFVPDYLKYLLEHLDNKGAQEVMFTEPKTNVEAPGFLAK